MLLFKQKDEPSYLTDYGKSCTSPLRHYGDISCIQNRLRVRAPASSLSQLHPHCCIREQSPPPSSPLSATVDQVTVWRKVGQCLSMCCCSYIMSIATPLVLMSFLQVFSQKTHPLVYCVSAQQYYIICLSACKIL